jgi:hypothetical protein
MLSMGSLYSNTAYSTYAASYPATGYSSGMMSNMSGLDSLMYATGSTASSYPVASGYATPLAVTQTTTTNYQMPTYTPPSVTMMPVLAYVPVMTPTAASTSQTPVDTTTQLPTASSYLPYTNYQTPAPTPTPTPTATGSTQASNADMQMLFALLPLLLELMQAMLQSSQATSTSDTPSDTTTDTNTDTTPTPTYTPPCYTGGDDGSYTGDPHLVGFDGEKYDVMGQPGKTYNMLSDQGIQYNTTFAKWGDKGATVISQAGIQVGDQKIYFDRTGNAPTINGQSMTVGDDVDLPNGGSANWDGQKLTVKTKEYTIDLQVKEPNNNNGAYLDSQVTINDGGPFSDMVAPHGLLGQTADGVDGKKNTGHDQGKQGGTVIDGTVDDYEEADLWSHSDKFSRFDAQVDPTKTETDADGNVTKTFDADGNVLFERSLAPLSVAA